MTDALMVVLTGSRANYSTVYLPSASVRVELNIHREK